MKFRSLKKCLKKQIVDNNPPPVKQPSRVTNSVNKFSYKKIFLRERGI
jgi:hypothetical protein